MNDLTDEQLDKIDQLLAGELTAEESAQIRDLIISDAAWREAYQFRLTTREASKFAFQRNMKEKFVSLERTQPKQRKLYPLWLAAAATIALLVTALLWFFPSRQSNALLAEYTRFPNIIAPIEKSGDTPTPRDRAYQSYELGEYEKAIDAFKQMDSITTVDRLYMALSYMEAGRNTEASPLFSEVQASSNPRWSNVADWYLMWMYLKEGNTDEARRILERISSEPNHRYHQNALELKPKLPSR
jgi:tetratricopeptide (TPR) repeat protein